jgi:hypothetical protein
MPYTHYLITRGASPKGRDKARPFTPLLLTSIHLSLLDVRKELAPKLAARESMFAAPGASPLEVLKQATRPYMVDLLSDLWLSEVRLAPFRSVVNEGEDAIHWILFGSGRLPEPWQGGADGVIPPLTPVTIRRLDSATRFEVIEP